ncbi:MAG: hypothetical protein KAJ52_00825 [Sedimentisphaerales bacterium]|nr:hypothetical protein [Sedimentisphaerales bacterium]
MQIWTANPLESKNDIFQRGFFRLFWCLIGAIAISGLSAIILSYRQILNVWWAVPVSSLIATVVSVLGGILIDFKRLNKQQKT